MRSSNGTRASAAWASTRRLKASKDSSRFRKWLVGNGDDGGMAGFLMECLIMCLFHFCSMTRIKTCGTVKINT
jgi:hypothetical protein